MHEGEVVVSEEDARSLIAAQFPQWASEPIRRLDSTGTVNAIFRIGAAHSARFPLLGADAQETRRFLEDEARSSMEFARVSPFSCPLPVGTGEPGPGYPLCWSVQTWIAGCDATVEDPGASRRLAVDLARLISSLRRADTGGRKYSGTGRGGHLADHDDWIDQCLRESEGLLDVAGLAVLWEHFRQLPRDGEDVMSHGDLTPPNLLVTEGRLAGVLDCGAFGPADPALDLIVAWNLLEDDPRELLRSEVASDDLEWERGKAWAFEQAMGLVWYYADTNPTMTQIGRRTLARILAATPL